MPVWHGRLQEFVRILGRARDAGVPAALYHAPVSVRIFVWVLLEVIAKVSCAAVIIAVYGARLSQEFDLLYSLFMQNANIGQADVVGDGS